jgi:cation diffusion facilitator family transporter
MAMINDAFNNLSDMASSFVLFFGMRSGVRPADHEHPLGHGRAEYIATLVIAFIILALSVQLITQSIDRILNPIASSISITALIINIVAIGIKLWMYFFNQGIYRTYNSLPNKGTAMDSLNDVLVTSFVMISTILAPLVDFPIDGIAGIFVALFISYTGLRLATEATKMLLGSTPNEEIITEIINIIKSDKRIFGFHDLSFHDYGPSNQLGTVNIEIEATTNLITAHNIVDELEAAVFKKNGIQLSMHIDPVVFGNEKTKKVTEDIIKIASSIDESLSIENVRLVEITGRNKVLFDVVFSKGLAKQNQEIELRFKDALKEKLKNYSTDFEILKR